MTQLTRLQPETTITVPAYRDLALVLDDVVRQWCILRMADRGTAPATRCEDPTCTAPDRCTRVIITEFLQVLAAYALDTDLCEHEQASLIAEVPKAWPSIVSMMRAAMTADVPQGALS